MWGFQVARASLSTGRDKATRKSDRLHFFFVSIDHSSDIPGYVLSHRSSSESEIPKCLGMPCYPPRATRAYKIWFSARALFNFSRKSSPPCVSSLSSLPRTSLVMILPRLVIYESNVRAFADELKKVIPQDGKPWYRTGHLLKLNFLLMFCLLSSSGFGYDG